MSKTKTGQLTITVFLTFETSVPVSHLSGRRVEQASRKAARQRTHSKTWRKVILSVHERNGQVFDYRHKGFHWPSLAKQGLCVLRLLCVDGGMSLTPKTQREQRTLRVGFGEREKDQRSGSEQDWRAPSLHPRNPPGSSFGGATLRGASCQVLRQGRGQRRGVALSHRGKYER